LRFAATLCPIRTEAFIKMLMTNTLHILCFGDSLTAGYSDGITPYHPYTGTLQTSLEKAFPFVNITIDNHGLPGDQVTSPPGEFHPRMDIIYDELSSSTPYDFAIILGGTNDLAHNRLARDIFSALQKVWAIPVQHDTKVLSLTIPDCAGCGSNAPGQLKKLNPMILGHRAEKPGIL